MLYVSHVVRYLARAAQRNFLPFLTGLSRFHIVKCGGIQGVIKNFFYLTKNFVYKDKIIKIRFLPTIPYLKATDVYLYVYHEIRLHCLFFLIRISKFSMEALFWSWMYFFCFWSKVIVDTLFVYVVVDTGNALSRKDRVSESYLGYLAVKCYNLRTELIGRSITERHKI